MSNTLKPDAFKLYCDPPRLDWTSTGPLATDYGDVYFSAEDGLAETRAVFLDGCGLPQAWAGKSVFTVAELGFGTGLNALALWDLWKREGPSTGRLHFVSIEKHPFSREQAQRALADWPELAPLAEQLLAQWPCALKGAHRLRFDDDRFAITIFHDNADAALPQIEADVDAWFLDGFAPAKNDAMWNPSVFDEMARLSKPGARVATFTVAGHVRRSLQGAGFTVEKKPGFGRKRERLEATFTGSNPVALPDTTNYPRVAPADGPIAIIGGGIAGASLAFALRQRGREAAIFDPKGLAGGASSAPSGLLTPRLENADRPHVRATLAAFDYARSLYDRLDVFIAEGALRLTRDEKEAARLVAIAEIMGADFDWDAERQALWMARAGRFDPGAVVRALAGNTPVFHETGETANLDAFSTVIWANGPKAALDNDIQASHGRVIVANGKALSHPIVWGGYVSATPDGRILIGATHDRDNDPGPDAAAETLLADLESRQPEIVAGIDGSELEHWSGVRAVTPDRLPVSGSAADYIVLSGLGSRGFAHAPLLAESLISDLCGEPSPLERAGREALHPNRFRIRAMKRQH